MLFDGYLVQPITILHFYKILNKVNKFKTS